MMEMRRISAAWQASSTVRADREDVCRVPRVRARVPDNEGGLRGKALLARRSEISSLCSLSSLKGCQDIELKGKEQRLEGRKDRP